MRSSPPPRVALLALSLGVLLAVPRPAAAQGAAALEQAEARLAAGDAAEARRLVNAWWQAAGEGGGGSERSRGLALRARLAVDSEAAERDWLAIILGYPAAREAPSALLHMGQLLLGRGEAERSSAYLSRLVMDYPGHALRPDAFLWLARARRVAGHAEGACLAVAEGLAAAPDAELRALLGVEEARCPDGLRATVRVPAREARPPARPSAPAAGAEAGDWAIQAGAYRSAASASTLVRRLEAAGFQPRMVSVPGSQLVRVRVGRFGSAAGASALRARLAAAGFEAVVVGDAGRERPAR